MNAADTAFILVCSALVMFMTPGLALFYGGLVRARNVLSTTMHSFILLGVASIVWAVIGYTLAFGPDIGGVIGGLDFAFLNGVGMEPSESVTNIPHLLFMAFQCMFAVITPALIIGAFAERMKFSSFLAFTVAWLLLIYVPLAHMVWSANGWLYKLGALDFAGGTVVHINAGFAALATALFLGKRTYLKPFPPHNLPFAVIGSAMLWFGWFGFNAGSALAADGLAASAFMTTNTAAAAAALLWALLDSLVNGKPTVLGVATGAVVGLVAVTPAAGFVNVGGALIIGAVASGVCFLMVSYVKGKFGYDDSLDAFGCHGIGGLVGALLTGVFADPAVWKAFGGSYAGAAYGNPLQLGIQGVAATVSILMAFFGTLVILKLIDLLMGLRVDVKTEAIGLDITQHNERAYTVIE